MAFPAPAPSVSVYRGDTTPFLSLQIKNADGTPKDISSSTWIATWRLSVEATTSLPLAIDISDSVIGWLVISASAAITAQMTGPGIWDLQETTIDGDIFTKVVGKTKFKEDVTHS